jgi:large subunit ribosomal protein L3
MIKNWASSKQAALLGFAGYKAGMISIMIVDNKPKSPTKGEEIMRAVTILEVPPLKVLGLRLYHATPYGTKSIGECWADHLDKELSRRLNLPKPKLSEAQRGPAKQEVSLGKKKFTVEQLKAKLPDVSNIRVLVYTQPDETGFGKKMPEVFEIPIGGSVQEQFDYANSILGKEISVNDVFKAGQYVDVHGITKGKGFEGDIKRFGVKLASHKSEFGRRHRATMGPISPPVTAWWIAMPGQMGFHKRTDYNKQILKISDIKTTNVNPTSGISRYGLVKGNYILIDGSIPGAKKRLVILTHPIRPGRVLFEQAPDITHISVRSQQG